MKEKLVTIYNMLSALSVSGDAVDVFAAVRRQLRALIKEVDEANGKQTDKRAPGGDNC